jgi:nucleotide-binding universal stress UspA family protein
MRCLALNSCTASSCADWAAALLVTRAYGTRRWAERVFGGTTVTALDTMTVTVLLSH